MIDFANPAARRRMLRDCVRVTVTNVRHYQRLGMPEQVIALSIAAINGLRRQHSSHFRRV